METVMQTHIEMVSRIIILNMLVKKVKQVQTTFDS